ncbi:Membrane protein DedA, SNARE-associated domain [Rhizobium sp. EC-SD404]|nr:Membrane protein DedA, SNARE-associated domain [Rhizobium sp. EC-SD404]
MKDKPMDLDIATSLLAWASAYGLFGVFMIGMAERFVPILPSTGFLLAIGVGASSGAWSLPSAILASTVGSLIGCAAWYFAARGMGDVRSTRILARAGRLFGLSSERVMTGTDVLQRKSTALAFSSQLLPTVRLFSPAFAAIIGTNWRPFLTASAAGILVWNAVFILAGYKASYWMNPADTMLVSIAIYGALSIGGLGWVWMRRPAI